MRNPSGIEIRARLVAISRIEELMTLALMLVLLAALLVVLGVRHGSSWLLIVSQLATGFATLVKVKIACDELVLVRSAQRYVRSRVTEMGTSDARSLKRAMRHARSVAVSAWYVVILMASLPLVIGIARRVPNVGEIFLLVIPMLAMQIRIMSDTYGKLAEAILESQRKRRIRTIRV